jgi:hypothetical protein
VAMSEAFAVHELDARNHLIRDHQEGLSVK